MAVLRSVRRYLGLSSLFTLMLMACAGDITGPPGQDGADGGDGSVALKKPVLVPHASLPDRITLPASESKPAEVVLGQTRHQRTANLHARLDAVGENAMDVAVATRERLYYVYAVPASDPAEGFSVRISSSEPASGPFASPDTYSYLGAVMTDASAQVIPFSCNQGNCLLTQAMQTYRVDQNTPQSLIFAVPVSAYRIYVKAYFSSATMTSQYAHLGSDATCMADTSCQIRIRPNLNNDEALVFAWLALLESQTLFASSENDSNKLEVEAWGWEENLALYP